MPEKEADHLTPATRLLEKKREMAEVEQALQATKDVGPSVHLLDVFCTHTVTLVSLSLIYTF